MAWARGSGRLPDGTMAGITAFGGAGAMVANRRWSRRAFLTGLGALTFGVGFAGRGPWAPGARAAARIPGRLRFGIQTAPQNTTYGAIEPVWREADDLGYDTAFVFDHFMPIFSDPGGPCLEGWTLLSALAAKTQRIRVGVLVTGNTYRYPAVLAKMAVTVDQVSEGRLILGMGAGWFEEEHIAYGIPMSTVGGRARRLVEAVEVVKLLFTQKRSTFTGRYYALKDAPFEPKAVQQPHPPILIGGMGPKVIQPLAARHADIWHFFVRGDGPDAARKICTNFDAICRQVGRDPAAVEKSTSLRPTSWTQGTGKELRAQVQALADAGVEHLILSLRAPFDRGILRGFAKEVMPAFRS